VSDRSTLKATTIIWLVLHLALAPPSVNPFSRSVNPVIWFPIDSGGAAEGRGVRAGGGYIGTGGNVDG
jgi:hypothetical protein